MHSIRYESSLKEKQGSLIHPTHSPHGNSNSESRNRPITIPHPEEGEYGVDGLNFRGHMVAGAMAGAAEHVFMFPVDTVKTKMQTLPTLKQAVGNVGVKNVMKQIIRQDGVSGLYRGVGAVVIGAIPGHALHFTVYEAVKSKLGGSHTAQGQDNSSFRKALADMAAGSCATLAHDGVSTPADVIKQRMQLYGVERGYSHNVWRCLKSTYAEGGLRAFYASYPTTVAMNVPVFAAYFATYERVKKIVTPIFARPRPQNIPPASSPLKTAPAEQQQMEEFIPSIHCIAGGAAGALSAACSNPLDVIKTRLQTQPMADGKPMFFNGPMECVRDLLRQEGAAGFLKGIKARIIYQAPASACCWLTYEYVKHLLNAPFFGDFFLDNDDD